MILLTCFGLAIFITYFFGFLVIPFLKKLKVSQRISREGPTWHKTKSKTPTMGGVIFICGVVGAAIIGYILLNFAEKNLNLLQNISVIFASLSLALGFGLIGFLDDYLKVIRNQNQGLKAKEKFILQVVLAAAYLLQMVLASGYNGVLLIPFCGQIDIGWLIYPVNMFIILGCVNGVNLTDGIDGLATSVTAVAGLGFLYLALLLGNFSTSILAICLVGGCVGFLIWNFYPAKVMMGDIGSLFLGGILVSVSFLLNVQVALLFFGIVYVIETLSVMIQMTYYRFTKRRLFKMSPIHHHFEMLGYGEIKINLLFIVVQVIGSVLGVISVQIALS
ncbi:MAG: phospho-N-acetylmuramoyl-pentapeptide-transferase [Oscillospiraceae bacterium]|jgi:phospho-N-acetylmuramoyl-pentapeptide-transferase|nr:phospho-N-acetylmuramoyl-pentapeptide-transferase [Oscillospiraceae bacterium]